MCMTNTNVTLCLVKNLSAKMSEVNDITYSTVTQVGVVNLTLHFIT